MARLMPDRIPETAPSSERRVYAALNHLPDDWTVFHSVAWQAVRQGRPGDGEADFVLLHPRHGLIVIEVKGGGIEIMNGRWYSRDRNGARHALSHDPFQQATESRHTLVDYLKGTLPGLPYLPAGHAVAFPDLTSLNHLGMHAPPPLCLTRPDLTHPTDAITRVIDHWKLAGDISRHIDDITALLAPTVRSRVLLRDTVAEVNARLVTLTSEQTRVLDGLRRNRRALIYGGAGTGKTVLAVERTRRLAIEGANVLLTCFNRPLANHLAREFERVETVRVNSFHSLCRWQMAQAGMAFPEEPPQEWWQYVAPDALVDAAKTTGFGVDAIVIDEGQDFDATWFTALQMLTTDPDTAPVYVFADSHQVIYRDNWQPPFDGPSFDLAINCRNTMPIAERVAGVFSDEPASLGADGPAPTWIEVVNEEGGRAQLRSLLHRLINEGQLRPDQVVVLTQRRRTCLDLRKLTMAGQLLVAPGGLGVAVETIHRFKGLEADAVIVLLHSLRSTRERALAYIAMSRARAHLTVIAPAELRDKLGWQPSPG